MGAVNTVVIGQSADKPDQRIPIGENPDWVGIRNCIKGSPVTLDSSCTPLVIGAGGAARAALYAIQQLGISNVTVVNRSKERAEGLASSFTTLNISILNSLQQADAPVSCIVACIPADDIAEAKLFVLGKPGILVEMAYRPNVTALMKAVQRLGSWSVSNGVEVLRNLSSGQDREHLFWRSKRL
jgi:shikimate 5-dehydrogenase